jgi:Rrf2 family protein
MELSLTGEYAIRALLYLAGHPYGTLHRITDVVAAAEVPDTYFRKILPLLIRAGFVHSVRGVKGGIQLTSPANQITLLHVFEAVEGKLFLNACLIHPHACHRSSWCAVHTVWADLQEQMKAQLSSQTLEDLVNTNSVNLANVLSRGDNVDPQ